MLVGIGFDIHRHTKEEVLYLGGLKLDGAGFIAHSDGDIVSKIFFCYCTK